MNWWQWTILIGIPVFTLIDVWLHSEVRYKIMGIRLAAWPGSGYYLRWKYRKEF